MSKITIGRSKINAQINQPLNLVSVNQLSVSVTRKEMIQDAIYKRITLITFQPK